MTKPILLPGLQLRTALLSGAFSTAELDALGADPAEVFAIKTADDLHLRAASKESQKVEGRTRRYVYSDERVDRHGDVILAKGWDVASFAAAEGPILWGHNHGAPPIGKSSKPVKKRVDEMWSLVGDVTFAEDEVNPEAGLIWRLADAGFLKTGSVGFKPIQARYGEDLTDKEREKWGLGKWGVLFEAQELLEFSIVSVPANPGAREIDKGLKWLVETGAAKDAEIDRLVKTYPLTLAQAEERVKDAVRSTIILTPDHTAALKALCEEAEAEKATEERVEEEAIEGAGEPEVPTEAQERSADDQVAPLVSAVSELVKQVAALVDAATVNTESAIETAKATRQLADAAYNQLERSSKTAGERSVSDAASKSNGEGDESDEPGAGEPDAETLGRIAKALEAITAKR